MSNKIVTGTITFKLNKPEERTLEEERLLKLLTKPKTVQSRHRIGGKERDGQISLIQAPKGYVPPPQKSDHFKQMVNHGLTEANAIADKTLETLGYSKPEDIPDSELTEADGYTRKHSNLYYTERFFDRIANLEKTLKKVDASESIDPELLYEAVYNALTMKHAQMVARSYALEPQTIAGTGLLQKNGNPESRKREAVKRYRDLRQENPAMRMSKAQEQVALEYGVTRKTISAWIKKFG